MKKIRTCSLRSQNLDFGKVSISIPKIIFSTIIICFLTIFPLKTQGISLKGGDTFDTAVELTPGTYEGERIKGGEKEYFFVNPKAGQALQFEVTLVPRGTGIGGVILYDEDILPLVKKEELVQYEPATFKIIYLLNSEKDSHKIYIKKYCRLFYFDSFTINFSIGEFYDASSKTDAGESLEKAMDISYGKYKGYLSGENGNDKKDFYKIPVEKIGNLVLKTALLSEPAEISVIIYDKEKNIIAEKTGSFGKEIRASRYITKPGDYFIEFKGVSQEIIPYEFEVLSQEGEVEVEKKSLFETLNFKFIFGIIFLILILFVAGKIIYSVWKK